jgi:hypothetical protein
MKLLRGEEKSVKENKNVFVLKSHWIQMGDFVDSYGIPCLYRCLSSIGGHKTSDLWEVFIEIILLI